MMGWRAEILQHIHEYLQNQIALGDAKAAGILAWDAAMVALVAGTGGNSQAFGLHSLVLLVAVGCMTLSVVFCALALAPNAAPAGNHNRVSFVDISSCSVEMYAHGLMQMTQDEAEREICDHVHLLAGIAKRKYDRVRYAIVLSAGASALLILSLML